MPIQPARALRPCTNCGSESWTIRRLIDSAGRERFPYVCEVCGARTQVFEKRCVATALVDVDAHDSLTSGVVSDRERCPVCGKVEILQEHHWAPFCVFGNDADRWPKTKLCQSCHSAWHQKMTPAHHGGSR